MAQKKQSKISNSKLRNNEAYFNYKKKSHYAKNCHFSTSNKKKPEKSLKKAKQAQWNKNQAKAIKLTTDYDNSNVKPYPAKQAFITPITDKRK